MTNEQRLKNLKVPTGMVDVVLDTDAYNETDDQYAIALLLRSKEKLNPVALYAAPFKNYISNSPEDGMLKSYDEIKKLLTLANEPNIPVFYGSRNFLADEKTPQPSDAASDLIKRAMQYSPEKPLYVVAIGAITNIASALLMKPEIAENIVIIWLAGHALHWDDTREFNMVQDIAASRVVMQSDAPFVSLPANGVVSEFRASAPELEFWLKGKTPISDFLYDNTMVAEGYRRDFAWTRVIWDVTAIGWLLNDDNRFMTGTIMPIHLCGYDGIYEKEPIDLPMFYVKHIKRDNLMTHLFQKLTQ